jgi:hypothetical protein
MTDKSETFSGACHCGAPGIYVMYEGFVKNGKQIWFCAEHKPDFRALHIEHLRKQGKAVIIE